MDGWLSGITNWISSFFKSLWNDFVEFMSDFWIGVFQLILDAFASIFDTLPVPDFLLQHSMADLFSQLPPGILYFVGLMNIHAGFSLIAAAFAFRMLRKFATLFQW